MYSDNRFKIVYPIWHRCQLAAVPFCFANFQEEEIA